MELCNRWLVLAGILLTGSASGACSREELSVRVEPPAEVGPWAPTSIKIVLHNKAKLPMIPLDVEASTAKQIIGSWRLPGKWGKMVRARETPSGWDVLWDRRPVPKRRYRAVPDEVDRAAKVQLLRVDALAPGESVELTADFAADYAHGAQIQVKATYVILNPRRLPTCQVEEPPKESRAWAECPRVQLLEKSDSNLYLPLRLQDLKQHAESFRTFVPLAIAHPQFDIDDARRLTKIDKGPFAFDLQGLRWILLDEAKQQTVLVAPSGEIERLPGNWLGILVATGGGDRAPCTWYVRSGEDGTQLIAELAGLGIQADWRHVKGGIDPHSVEFVFQRHDMTKLAKLARGLDAHMVNHISTRRSYLSSLP